MGLYSWSATVSAPPPAVCRLIVATVVKDTAYHGACIQKGFGLKPSHRSVRANVFVGEEPDEDEEEQHEDDSKEDDNGHVNCIVVISPSNPALEFN